MNKYFAIVAMLLAGAAMAYETTLFEDDFESYCTGDFLGQGATQVMKSSVSCAGENPAPGEIVIVEEAGNKSLKVTKIASPEGVTKPGSDRGVKIPLDWGGVAYEGGDFGTITITGNVTIPDGSGYGELRLVSENDKPMMRFCFQSSDYNTYCYTANRNADIDAGSANREEEHFADARYSGKVRMRYQVADTVVRNTLLTFRLVINTETACLESYSITDGNELDFSGSTVCHLENFNNQPMFVEFTAVGNGYDTNRPGYVLDNVKVVYDRKALNWVPVFEDDFSQYAVGTSLTASSEDYVRLGSAPTFSDEIKYDEKMGNYAYLWMGVPEGNPVDGVCVNLENRLASFEAGAPIRFVTTYYCPDNGCWTKLMNGDTTLATHGFHSANLWFTTWGSGDTSPRYDDRTPADVNNWITTTMIARADEGGYYLDSITRQTSADPEKRYGTKWSSYFDTTLADTPSKLAVQVQGWPGFDGRYVRLSNVKVEVAVPEPAILGLLALAALALARRR